jgi:xyloglucan fucosyltransferase
MVMGRPSNSHGGGGDEERLPLRGVLETSPSHHAAVQPKDKEARRGGSRLWRASVRAGLLLCLLTVPAVLLLLWWQADSSPQWVFDFEPPEEDDDQGTRLLPAPVYTVLSIVSYHTPLFLYSTPDGD